MVAPADSIRTTDGANGYSNQGGTSLAAPEVASAAALIWAYTSVSRDQVIEYLGCGAEPLTGPGDNERDGSGRLDVHRSLLMAMAQSCVCYSDLDFVQGTKSGNVWKGPVVVQFDTARRHGLLRVLRRLGRRHIGLVSASAKSVGSAQLGLQDTHHHHDSTLELRSHCLLPLEPVQLAVNEVLYGNYVLAIRDVRWPLPRQGPNRSSWRPCVVAAL